MKLRINFFGNFVERYPEVSVPKMLNKPIIDNNVAAHHPGKPLSFRYSGMWVATKVMCQPHTKKPSVK